VPLFIGAAGVTLTYLVTALPAAMREWQDRDVSRRELVRQVTTTATGSGDGVLLVGQAPPAYFRPRRARLTIRYQHRDAEQEAIGVLAGGEPLLLVGNAMAGKSRLGEYLIRELYPDRPLWTPQPNQFPSLLAAGVPDQAVMWLDELHEFLNVDGLRTDWVNVLTSRGAVVVATMRGVERDKFTPLREVRHPQFAALERFSPVQVRDDDPTENARLAGALETPEQHASIQRVGLGAFLGGGPIAQARLD